MFGPVVWVVLCSFKSEAQLVEFPPSALPYGQVTVTVPGHPEPLPLFRVRLPDGAVAEMAQLRRIGIQAQMVDPAAPERVIRVDVADREPVRALSLANENYTALFERFHFLRYLWNSVFITVTATLIMLLVNSMAAYTLAKYDFRGRDLVFVLTIATLLIPPTVVLVPVFLVVSELGLLNSPWGVIWPGTATPTGVFLLRQSMLTIPDELIDAARMDNASEWKIYWRIVFLLAAPALAVLAIFAVMWRWNDFLLPLIVVSRSEQFTLQVALNSFKGEMHTQWGNLLAMTVLTLLPITLVFGFLQRYITNGIATTVIKWAAFDGHRRARSDGQTLRHRRGDPRRRTRDSLGCLLRVRGLLRLRQVDAPAHDRRSRADQRGRAPDRRGPGQRDPGGSPRSRHGLPVLCSLTAHDGAAEPRFRPREPEDARGRDRPPCRRGSADASDRGTPRPSAQGALGRPAATGGDRPGGGPRARGVPVRRAALEPRRGAPRPDADRTQGAPRLARQHDDLRHSRPGRGHDNGPPYRGALRGADRAGRPLELYHRPANLFVAGFLGSPKTNFLKVRPAEGGVRLASGDLLAMPDAALGFADLTLGVRPEHLAIGSFDGAGVAGRVRLAEHLGAESYLHLETEAGPLTVRSGGDVPVVAGERLRILIPIEACHLFGPHGRAVLSAPGLRRTGRWASPAA